MAATLFAFESFISGRPHSSRRGLESLNGDLPLVENWKEMTVSPDEPDTISPSSVHLLPKDPDLLSEDHVSVNQVGTETSMADTDISSSIDSTIKSNSEDTLVTDDIRQSFLRIQNGECQYGLYAMSANKDRLLFKKCGQTSDRKDISDSISRSATGFALIPLGGGAILSIRNLYNENDEVDAIAILRAEEAWLRALKPVFGGVIAIGYVFDHDSLAALMYRYFAPAFPSPAWWFLPSP